MEPEIFGEDELMKLFNDDCFKVFDDLLDKSVDCVITDPPYLMDTGGIGKTDLSERQKARRDNELNALSNFGKDNILKLAEQVNRVCKKLNFMTFCSKDQIRFWYEAFPDVTPVVMFWGKSNPMPLVSNTLLSDVEYALYFREEGVKCYANYRTASRFDITPVNKKDKEIYNHPTVKPLQIIKRYISFMTREGDTVLDPFMGTGTVGVACVQMNRDFVGIELDTKHYDMAVQRIHMAQEEKLCQLDLGGI